MKHHPPPPPLSVYYSQTSLKVLKILNELNLLFIVPTDSIKTHLYSPEPVIICSKGRLVKRNFGTTSVRVYRIVQLMQIVDK